MGVQCTITPEDISLGSEHMVEKMKRAGFRFISDKCPIRLTPRYTFTVNGDGTYTYHQELAS